MPSLDPKAGNRYLTVTDAPVQVLEVHDGSMVLQSLVSDNRLMVTAGYPLRPFKGKAEAFEVRPSPYSPYVRPRRGRPEPKPLAPIIDALLLAGNMAMRGILRELRRKASAACRGRDLEANVRARVYWLRKRGHRSASLKTTRPAVPAAGAGLRAKAPTPPSPPSGGGCHRREGKPWPSGSP